MLVKTVKVSSKGQITLPKDALMAVGAEQGTEFVLVQENERILLVRADRAGKGLIDEFEGWQALAVGAFADVWDNPEDDVWDTFGDPPTSAKRHTAPRSRD